MFELKPISKDGIPAALKKAEQYRLLNEPWEAESICRDILNVDPDNQGALILLILAITDGLEEELGPGAEEASALIPSLKGDYEQAYYSGIICEHQAKALLKHGTLGGGPAAHNEFRKAMKWYEKAEKIRPAGDEAALLRWNTCARLLNRHKHLRPAPGPPPGTKPRPSWSG